MASTEPCNYWEDSDDWNYCYGNNGEGGIVAEGEYVLVMAGGGGYWWNYVIDRSGIYVESKYGRVKLNKMLVSSPDSKYLSEQDLDYKLKEEEVNMFDIITECYEEAFDEYEEN